MCPLILHASTAGWFRCCAKELRELYGDFWNSNMFSLAVCIPAFLNNPSAEKHTRFSISFFLALNLSFQFILLFCILRLFLAGIVDTGWFCKSFGIVISRSIANERPLCN
jgi:hypothetical protein